MDISFIVVTTAARISKALQNHVLLLVECDILVSISSFLLNIIVCVMKLSFGHQMLEHGNVKDSVSSPNIKLMIIFMKWGKCEMRKANDCSLMSQIDKLTIYMTSMESEHI